MATKEEETIGNLYQGGYSTLDPNKADNTDFVGYRIPASKVGAPTKPDTANQIQQVSQLLNQGIIPIEVGVISPEVFDQIPKQHFKEIKRAAKLTGSEISIHSPLIEPSGIGEQGWSEIGRESAERHLKEVIDKSRELDDQGQVPVTIHSAGIAGTEYRINEKGEKVIDKLIVVDRETGKPVQALEEDKKYYPGGKVKEIIQSPEENLRSINNTQWNNDLSQIEINRSSAERIMRNSHGIFRGIYVDWKKSNLTGIPFERNLSDGEQEEMKKLYSADEYVHQAALKLNGVFSKAYECAKNEKNDKVIGILDHFSKEYGKILGKNEKGEVSIASLDPKTQSDALFFITNSLKSLSDRGIFTPKQFVPIEKFAIEQSAKTFANVAMHSYEKYKDKAPIISIENLYPGFAFSSLKGDGVPGMEDLIVKSKEEFVKKAKSKGISESEAKKQADKIIGMTLDVGHLNIHKKKGFKDEDLRKEVEAIAKHVKHVHLTDNFGHSDSHLPIGMGNVPFKEHLEALEKAGKKDVRKIIEAGGFVQHFNQSPYIPSLEGLGSPIYSEPLSPYWNQSSGFQQGYAGGYGMMLPQTNYETFGAGFSQLPPELGGDRQGGAGGRMGGGNT